MPLQLVDGEMVNVYPTTEPFPEFLGVTRFYDKPSDTFVVTLPFPNATAATRFAANPQFKRDGAFVNPAGGIIEDKTSRIYYKMRAVVDYQNERRFLLDADFDYDPATIETTAGGSIVNLVFKRKYNIKKPIVILPLGTV